MSLKNNIVSVVSRTSKGFTVGEIFDRVATKMICSNSAVVLPHYSTLRARVYELANSGSLLRGTIRTDKYSGALASTFLLAKS